jgi:glycerol uptake facilitator-like aquaporin
MQRLHTETSLSVETSIVRGLFIEMFLTALLIFTIFMLAAEKHRATFIAPIGIGLALFVAHLAGARFTGGSCPFWVMPGRNCKLDLHLLMRLFTQPA